MNRKKQRETVVSVLVVCMGNICRSPIVQGALEKHLCDRELPFKVLIDSAGTHSYHVGEAPDHRAIAAASKAGIDISGQRARQIEREDFTLYDYIIAMDKDNLISLSRSCPKREQHRISLLMDYAESDSPKYLPDPFYGGTRGFDQVVTLAIEGTKGLLDTLHKKIVPSVA